MLPFFARRRGVMEKRMKNSGFAPAVRVGDDRFSGSNPAARVDWGAMAGLDEILGESTAIQAVRDNVRRLLARPHSGRRMPSILIQGETGTGKGLVARLIHRLGPRASGPFVDVNCAAIPDNLLESELFGYERGAFTDARRAKPGLFQTAHHGTIFLDEIGLLPAALQAKLLKVLEEQAVRRLGSTTSEPVDVWIISATNADLRAAVRERGFREDLYHRLAVLTLSLPPLRERGNDVLLLAERFLTRACADYGLPAKTLSPEAKARLLEHGWPGNVRELGNMAERVALLAEGGVVSQDILELPSSAAVAPPPAPAEAASRGSLQDAMRGHLLAALTQTGWNLSRTAALLGISRNTLRARIEKYGLRAGAAPAVALPRPVAEPKPAPIAPEPAPAATRIRWERHRITILRAELVPQGEGQRPPGNSREMETLMDKARAFGGQIDDLGQNAITAIFGMEPAEDAPQRAAHAALTIGKALERLHAEVGSSFGVKLAIHTSQCLVTQMHGGAVIDAESRQQAWNTLAPLLKEVLPGVAIVTAATKPFLERRFKLERLGDAEEPAYRLVGPEQYGLGPGGQMTVFVGRDQELAVLQSRLASAMAGRGHLVNIVGDAGMGKSRLLFEFRQRVAAQNVGYLQGRCVSYGSAIPYLPFLDLIRKGFGLSEADAPETTAEKIRSGLDALDLPPDESLPYLLNLLGIKDETRVLERLSPEAVKANTFESLRRVTVRANQARPLIIAVEDLHWIDRTSEEMFASLVEGLPGAPILFVTTYRPGYRPPWIERSYATQIALPPLSADESLALAESVLLARRLPQPLARIILDRAEGNPFFLEELTRAITERSDLSADTAVPETVQDVLSARIERLSEEPRRLLQTASVLGRAAASRVLSRMWGDDAQLARHLQELGRLEFLYEQRAGEDTVHVFKHALTQEVAYESLLAPQRRTLHAAAGRALEELHAGRLEDVYDRLAYHFSRTGETAKAVEYLTRFAEKAASRHAYVEAVAALEDAIARARELPPVAQDRLTLGLALRLAASLFYLGRFREILDLLETHEERLDRLGDPALAGLFHFQAGLVWSLMGDTERSGEHARKALEAARLSGDEATMGKAQYVLALDGLWWGRPQEVVSHGSTAAALLERTGERYWLGLTHWVLGINYALVGKFDAALGEEAQCGEIGSEIGSTRLETYAAWATGAIRAFMGEAEAGIVACRRSLERSPDPFNTATALGYLGYAYLENGEPAEAIGHVEQAIELVTRFRHRYAQVLYATYLSEALFLTGDLARARRVAAEALELATDVKFHYGKALSHRLLGRFAQAEGALAEALELLTQAREAFVSIEAQHEVGRTELLLADLAHARGDSGALRAHVAQAHELFARLGLPRYVERTRRLAADWGAPLLD
jgi:DNA-binding NtrC family response regulator/tetratricopeptide (TPR) repeat protein